MKPYQRYTFRHWLAGALLLFTTSAVCFAQVTLRWKFEKGDELRYVLEQNTDMTMTGLPTGDMSMIQNQKIFMTWKVGKVGKDGTADVSQKISRVVMTMEGGPFGNVKLDTEDDTLPDNPIVQIIAGPFKAMVGPEFKLQINGRGEIVRITIPEEVKRAVTTPGAAGFISESNLKQMFKFSTLLAKEPVSKDHKWSYEETIDMPFGAMHTSNTCTYKGVEEKGDKKLHRIDLKTTTSILKSEKGSLAPFEMEIKKQKASGRMLFDNEAGRLVHSVMNQELVMEVKTRGQTMQQEVKTAMTLKLAPETSSSTAKRK